VEVPLAEDEDVIQALAADRPDEDDTPAVMGEHEEDEEDTQAGGGYCEEIDRDQVPDVVVEEHPPGLGGLGTPLRHEGGHGALGDIDAELEELPVDAGSTPQGIRCDHFPDEGGDLGIDARTTSSRPARKLGPVLAEAATLPTQDGVGRHDDQRLPPTGPESGEAGPEQAVSRTEPRPGSRSFVDGDLLAQSKVLEGELAVAADEEREEPEHVE
jgi:hypothetical protein